MDKSFLLVTILSYQKLKNHPSIGRDMDYWSVRKKIKIPKLGLGTWQLKGSQCVKAVTAALETGYRHIDTAQIYENEEFVGKAIEESEIDRESIFLVTKVWKDHLDFRDVLLSVSRSLEKLRTDYIDLILIHWPNSNYPLEDSFSALQELSNTQKVKYIGVSNFTSKLLSKALKIYPSILCNQVEYHPFLSQKKLLKKTEAKKMFLTAYSPLARGEVCKNPVLRKIGKKYKKNPSQVTLRWLMDQKNVVVIPKSKTVSRIKSNFKIFDFHLSPEDSKKISKLQSKNKRLVNPDWAPKWD